jgi:hypothetical protein
MSATRDQVSAALYVAITRNFPSKTSRTISVSSLIKGKGINPTLADLRGAAADTKQTLSGFGITADIAVQGRQPESATFKVTFP